MVDDYAHIVEPCEREQAPQQARRFRQSQRATRCGRHSQQIDKCNYASGVNEAEPGKVDNDVASPPLRRVSTALSERLRCTHPILHGGMPRYDYR